MEGFVYVIGDYIEETRSPEYVKFGTTADSEIGNRLKALQTGNPRKLSIIMAIRHDSADTSKLCERLIHNKFKAKRAQGEWFQYDSDIEEFIDFGMQHFGEVVTDFPDMGLERAHKSAVSNV